MRERADVVEAEHPGRPLDGVRVAEQRVHGLGTRVPGFDGEQCRLHLIEPLRRLVTEDIGELSVQIAHYRALPANRKSGARR